MKKIEDYIPFYLGCELISKSLGENVGMLISVNIDGEIDFVKNGIVYSGAPASYYKPILRPLSDMPESDKKFYGNRQGMAYDPQEFMYLLKERYDLFGLIEAGLAIDATTLKEQPMIK